MKDLRIESVKIKGFRGIDKLDVNLKDLTICRGTNGAGKSSFEDSLLSIFTGGNHPENIRHGAKCSVVEVKLSDGRTLVKRQTPKGQTTTVLTENGVELPKAMEIVKSLANGPSLQPQEFIDAKPAERIAWLVAALGLNFSVGDLESCLPTLLDSLGGGPQPGPMALLREYNLGQMDLGALDKFHERVYAERREINRAADNQENEVKVLAGGLPQVQGDGSAERELISAWRQQLGECNGTEKSYETGIRLIAEKEIDAIKARVDSELRTIHQKYEAERLEIEKEITSLNEKLSAHQRAAGARQLIAEKSRQAARNRTVSENCTAILGAIDGAKAAKLSKIPVEGVSIRKTAKGDDEVFLAETAFPQLSEGEQLDLACRIVTEAPGALGLVVIDSVQRIAPDRLPEWLTDWQNSGFQVIAAQTDAGELTIETK